MKRNVFQNSATDSHELRDRHWRNGKIHHWLDTIISALSLIFFINYLRQHSTVWDKPTKAKGFFWSVILILLPFYRVHRVIGASSLKKRWFDVTVLRSSFNRSVLSSMLRLISIFSLESYCHGNNTLVGYISFILLFRFMDTRSLYDNIAMCIAYTVNVRDLPTFFPTIILLPWSFSLLGIVCGTIARGSSFRIWEHIRLLVIFHRKSKQERMFSNFVAAAHFSPDVLEFSAKRKEGTLIKKISISSTDRIEKDISNAPDIYFSNPVAKAASEAGILFQSDEEPILSIEKIRSLDGLERKLATVIAFKLVNDDDREYTLNNQRGHALHDLLDNIAFRHNISCVRKFGDTWVGCVGIHKSWETSRQDSYHAILMAAEALILAKNLKSRLCCAVESGKIDAGFVGSSNYDVFGPEIRWVLNIVEAKKDNYLLVGNTARNLNTRKVSSEAEVVIHFERISIDSMWKIKQESEKVYSVCHFSDLVKDESLLIEEFLDNKTTIKVAVPFSCKNGVAPTVLSWQAIQSILDGNETLSRSSSTKASADRVILNNELGCELQMTIEDRFGVSLDDSVLQGLSEDDLQLIHVESEANIRNIIMMHFFGSFFHFLFLRTPDKYRYGANDQVVSFCSLGLTDESEEFLGPLEVFCFGFETLTARQWFIPTKTSRSKGFKDTDVSLRESIRKQAVSHLDPTSGSIRNVGGVSWRSAGSGRSSGVNSINGSTGGFKNGGGQFKKSVSGQFGNTSNKVSSKLNKDIETGTLDFERRSEVKSERISELDDRALSTYLALKPRGEISQGSSSSMKLFRSKRRGVVVPNDSSLLVSGEGDGEDSGQQNKNPESIPIMPGRGLLKYTSDFRSLRYYFLFMVFYFVVIHVFLNSTLSLNLKNIENVESKTIYIYALIALYFFIINIFERKYDHLTCKLLFVIRALLAFLINPSEGEHEMISQILVLLGLWFPVALRQSYWCNCMEVFLHIYCSWHMQWYLNDNGTSINANVVVLVLIFVFWCIEYIIIVSYVVENVLIPEAQTLYQREYIHSREMLRTCCQNFPPKQAKDLYCPRRYRNCSILAVHVKAADVLPGLVDVLSVASFLKEIMLLIDGCVRECGLLKVTNFSACPDLSDDNTMVNHTTRTLICLRKIQSKLDVYSRRNSVNVSIGAGLSSGPVTMGLLGNNRFCFDVCGAARDLALLMASHQSDGIFASESFGSAIRNVQLSDDLVVHEVIVTAAHKTMKWLQLDGAFNKGMQLDDFEYMCMLGRGAFGSVHLLWDNLTEKEYAIKAIPRKKGSAIPKMIQREFIILQQIKHANVVSFKYCIINKDMIYLVMSYVRGGNLNQIVERNKPDLKYLTLWFAELVLALDYIHSLGIIHRDVKPANCMIDASGHLKLADFGLSKIVTPTPPSGLDLTGSAAHEDCRNASGIMAINLIKSILPLKSNMSERSVHIFLIDYNIMSFTAKRLKEMYFKVTAVSSNFEAQKLISQPGFNAEIILVDLDSVNMSDPTFTMTNGLALLRRLVVAVASKNIPIIGLSNIDDQDLMQRIIYSGARELLTLPIHRGARETLLKHGRLCHHLNRSTSSRIEKVKAKDGTSRILDDSDSPITVKTEGTTVSQVQPNSNLTGNTSSDNEKYLVQLRSANPVAQHVVSNGQQKHSAVGTIHFMAPEVIFEHKYGRSVDWWACGVTFYECTVRHHLFNGLEKDAIIMQILMAPIELDPISQHSPLLQNLVGGLLVRDPNLRMGTAGAKTIMKHDFFREIDWKTISESNPDYKPALLVNQRHSVTDKILFYGETQASKPKHLGTNSNNVDIRRTSVNSASHPRKRHANILNMRQRQDDFQKLTAQRKDWMSGSHVRSDINGEKRLDNANLVKKQSFDMFSNSLAAASLGIMNASLDWSITMLPEEDSSASEDEEEAENGVEGEQECEEEKEDYEMEEQEEEEQEEEELEKEEEKTEVEKGEESNLADGGKVEIEKNR